VRDDLGTAVEVPPTVRRVVSLVPSLTEAVAASGGADLLVGVTDYCTHPADVVAGVRRIRGTKNPDVAAVVDLAPDLVLANEEENRPADLAMLRAAGLAVWVTAPRSVPAALDSLAGLLGACRLGRPRWLDEAAAAWREPAPANRRRAFVPIWRRPWMAIGRDTFAGDVLERLGIESAHRDAADRYPRVALDDVGAAGVDLVVLPDEPYAFGERDLDAFAGWGVPIAFVSGRHLTWYGPSLAEARAVLTAQLTAARPAPPAAGG
jgi:ABC-type Fe3+-hydroxamate transport system substrate-binding protein